MGAVGETSGEGEVEGDDVVVGIALVCVVMVVVWGVVSGNVVCVGLVTCVGKMVSSSCPPQPDATSNKTTLNTKIGHDIFIMSPYPVIYPLLLK